MILFHVKNTEQPTQALLGKLEAKSKGKKAQRRKLSSPFFLDDDNFFFFNFKREQKGGLSEMIKWKTRFKPTIPAHVQGEIDTLLLLIH